jgi:hypothetical protein
MTMPTDLPEQPPSTLSGPLAQRTLDRVLGVATESTADRPLASGDEPAAATSWAQRIRGLFASSRAEPRLHWTERVIDTLAWIAMAGIIGIFFYLIYRGWEIFGK